MLLYSTEVAMHDSREEEMVLYARTVTLSVHISLLEKCSKIWITYFKKHKNIKNISNGVVTMLIYEVTSAIEYLYHFSLYVMERGLEFASQ